MVKTSLAEKIGKYRYTQRWHIPFKDDPWFFLFFLICLVLFWIFYDEVAWFSQKIFRFVIVCSLFFQQDPFFSATKDNNGVQIFLIYPNNNSMCAISRDNVQIILISDIKVHIKVQLVLSVWKKPLLSKSGY